MIKTSFRVTLKPLSELADNLSEIYKKIMYKMHGKIKISNQYVILLVLKINCTTNAKNVKRTIKINKWVN